MHVKSLHGFQVLNSVSGNKEGRWVWNLGQEISDWSVGCCQELRLKTQRKKGGTENLRGGELRHVREHCRGEQSVHLT